MDADAVVPTGGYLNRTTAPDAAFDFEATAAWLRSVGIATPGDFETGWIDSTSCCKLMCRVARLPERSRYLPEDHVQSYFSAVTWPDTQMDAANRKPFTSGPFEDSVLARTFVTLCIKHKLAIEFN